MYGNHQVSICESRCTGCGECVRDCPNYCLFLSQGKAQYRAELCIACGHCLAVCPQGAVSISGFDAAEIHPASSYCPDPEALLAAMESRRSVRRFQKKPIPRPMLEKLIQAGRYSPTARNKQGLSYVVLEAALAPAQQAALSYFRQPEIGPAILYSGADAAALPEDFFFKGAAAAILICGRNKLDAGLAASKMETLALSLGLGVFYSGFFTYAADGCASLRTLLGLAEGDKPAATLVLGWPDVHYLRTAPREKARVTWL